MIFHAIHCRHVHAVNVLYCTVHLTYVHSCKPMHSQVELTSRLHSNWSAQFSAWFGLTILDFIVTLYILCSLMINVKCTWTHTVLMKLSAVRRDLPVINRRCTKIIVHNMLCISSVQHYYWWSNYLHYTPTYSQLQLLWHTTPPAYSSHLICITYAAFHIINLPIDACLVYAIIFQIK